MKINTFTFISDTHDQHDKLKLDPTYALFHTGDATDRGSYTSMGKFFDWFAMQPAVYKFFVPGNHDRPYFLKHLEEARAECRARGIHLLVNDLVTIPPDIRIYGVACLSKTQSYSPLPGEIDILLTHEPPFGYGDVALTPPRAWEDPSGHLGIKELVDIPAWIHAYGHIHEGRGRYDIGNKILLNASNLDRTTRSLDHPPIVVNVDVDKVVWWHTAIVNL